MVANNNTSDSRDSLLPVMGLWIGDALSDNERLSMASFIACGHAYKLYAYRSFDNIPPGVELLDANEIIPEKYIFKMPNFRGYSSFANWFRWELLARYKGWWADTDIICLKPLGIPGELVAAFEARRVNPETYDIHNAGLANAKCKAPPVNNALVKCENLNHPIILKMRQFCAKPETFFYDRILSRRRPLRNIKRLLQAAGIGIKRRQPIRSALRMRYGSDLGGPRPFTDVLVTSRGASLNLLSAQSFYPVYWTDSQTLYDDTYAHTSNPFPDAYAVHLWNAAQKNELGGESTYKISPNSFVGQLVDRLL